MLSPVRLAGPGLPPVRRSSRPFGSPSAPRPFPSAGSCHASLLRWLDVVHRDECSSRLFPRLGSDSTSVGGRGVKEARPGTAGDPDPWIAAPGMFEGVDLLKEHPRHGARAAAASGPAGSNLSDTPQPLLPLVWAGRRENGGPEPDELRSQTDHSRGRPDGPQTVAMGGGATLRVRTPEAYAYSSRPQPLKPGLGRAGRPIHLEATGYAPVSGDLRPRSRARTRRGSGAATAGRSPSRACTRSTCR